MPWSTCTTRSPTFRSRRSDRNALVADAPPLGRAALFFEDIRLGVDLQTGVRQAEAARHVPTATSTAAYRASSARSTGTAKTSYSFSTSIVRSARPGVAATNSDVSPLRAAGESRPPSRRRGLQLNGRLTADVVLGSARRVGRRRRSSSSAELGDCRRLSEAASTSFQSAKALPAARSRAPRLEGLFVAPLHLLDELLRHGPRLRRARTR